MADMCKCGHSRTQHQCDEGCFAFAACRCEKFTPTPPTDMVSVPAEKIAALREQVNRFARWPYDVAGLCDAARAVVDAVETEPPPSMYPYED